MGDYFNSKFNVSRPEQDQFLYDSFLKPQSLKTDTAVPPINTPQPKNNGSIKRACEAIADFSQFEMQYWNPNDPCFRLAVNNKYVQILRDKQSKAPENEISLYAINIIPRKRTTRNDYDEKIANFNVNGFHPVASVAVYSQYLSNAQSALETCMRQAEATVKAADKAKTNLSTTVDPQGDNPNRGPFDKRLQRLKVNADDNVQEIMPMSTRHWEAATVGFVISKSAIEQSINNGDDRDALMSKRDTNISQLIKDNFFIGVPALTNAYALIKLYGSEGGEKIVNQRGDRRWYEVDMGNKNAFNFASVPSTTSLISWGNGDPYGRTPYHFSDFVFSKYWNKIQNNRLITLRRYGAPILDNLKFPGMDGITQLGKAGTINSSTNTLNVNNSGSEDGGSSGKIMFPPMASAITYFGEETGNKLNTLLKFSTGFRWEDAQASVWEVNNESNPDSKSGPGALFGGLAKFAEMLNVAGGSFDPAALRNAGNLPPDPYRDGPYENRIQGPLNRIDSVKKRKAGLDFGMAGLNLTFEYVARPVGGINPKAALLDIMSNFLVIGSASAVFFGGQHRFMAKPATYPFIGGQKGIEQWYAGKPIGWAKSVVSDFTAKGQSAGAGIFESAGKFFETLLSGGKDGGIFGALESLFTGGAAGNLTQNYIAKKQAGQIPYLSGLKALLTGEPVGEWHVTIGNPLNPIAMIGNLICNGIEVEFGEELGPDDFPTEIKITVKLDHGMARDRDAIQSIFNRGMGRIYDLPDSFLGSSDYQTVVDKATYPRVQTGTMMGGRDGVLSTGASTQGRNLGKPATKENRMHSDISVWRGIDSNFLSISPNVSTEQQADKVFRSAYRNIDWLAHKSLI